MINYAWRCKPQDEDDVDTYIVQLYFSYIMWILPVMLTVFLLSVIHVLRMVVDASTAQ